jgi:MFS family permease
MSAAPGGRPRYRDALRSRDLRLLVAAFSADSLGGWAYNVVLVVHLYDRTGSTAVIAATSACSWVPRLALSAYAGVVADRHERRRVMTVSAAACGVLVLVLAAGVAAGAPVLVLLALHAITSSCATFYEPAAQALLPEVVPEKDLVAANSLFGVCDSLAVVLGPALGGLFLLLGRPWLGFLFNAMTFLLALAAVRTMSVRSRGGGREEGGGSWSQLRTGFTALRAEPTAALLLLLAGLTTAVYGALSLLQVPLSQRFGTGAEGYAYLIAAFAAGGMLGRWSSTGWRRPHGLAPVIGAGLLLLTLPLAAATLVTSPLAGAALQLASGAGMVVVDVLAVTALQRDLPAAVLSRVLGLLDTLALAGALVASVTASLLLSVTSLEVTLLLLGFGFASASLLGLVPLAGADRRAAADLARLRPRIELLDELDLLAGAAPGTLAQLARALEIEELPARRVVVREGDPADALYVVVEGRVSVTTRRRDRLPDLTGGDYFGEIGLLADQPRTATVTTAGPTVLWRLSAETSLRHSRPAGSAPACCGCRAQRLARTSRVTAPRRGREAGRGGRGSP